MKAGKGGALKNDFFSLQNSQTLSPNKLVICSPQGSRAEKVSEKKWSENRGLSGESHQIGGRGGRGHWQMEGHPVIYDTFHCILYKSPVKDSISISYHLSSYSRILKETCVWGQ